MSDSTHETPILHEQPDAWHQHSSSEGAPQVEHGSHATPTALAITFVGMVLGVAAVVLILIAYFNTYVSQVKAEKQEGVSTAGEFESYRAEALGHLSGYGWSDPDADKVYVPIEQGMETVVTQYAALHAAGQGTDIAMTEGARADAP
ncbi:MAG: hypothetical protein R3B57_02295 [Phycisphaerales bacterium]